MPLGLVASCRVRSRRAKYGLALRGIAARSSPVGLRQITPLNLVASYAQVFSLNCIGVSK